MQRAGRARGEARQEGDALRRRVERRRTVDEAATRHSSASEGRVVSDLQPYEAES